MKKHEKSEETLSEKQKQTYFLNGIIDRNHDVIKDKYDSLVMSATILKIRKKNINMGKASSARSNTRSNLQINNIWRNSRKK